MGYADDAVDENDLRARWIHQLEDSWKPEPKPPQADAGSKTEDADPRRMMIDTLPDAWKLDRDQEGVEQ